MSTGSTEPEVVDRAQEIEQTLHPLCGRWFSTDYGILWAWLALDRGLAGDRTGRRGTQALWVACAELAAEYGALWWLLA